MSAPNDITDPAQFSLAPERTRHRQYEALCAYFVEHRPSAQELDLAALHDFIREQWGPDLAFVEIDVEDDAAVNALRSLARERRLRVFDEGPGEDWDLGA